MSVLINPLTSGLGGVPESYGTTAQMLSTTGETGAVFYNISYKQHFKWSDDRWWPLGYPDPRHGVVVHDDFSGGTGTFTGWTATNIAAQTSGTNAYGVTSVSTASASTFCRLQQQVAGILLSATQDIYLEALVSVPTLATVANDFSCAFGLHDGGTNSYNATSVAVDGCYFLYDRAANGENWILKTVSNSVATTTTTTTAIEAGTFYRVGVLISGITDVKFYVNGTLIGTHVSNIPSGAGRNAGAGFYLNKTAGASASAFATDYFSMWSFMDGGRVA